MYVIILISVLALLVYKYYDEKYKFWKHLNVPYLTPSIPFGNLDNFVLKKCQPAGIQLANFYKRLKGEGHRFGGIYVLGTPIFIPVDPDLIKNILAKDFTHFDTKNFFVNERDQPISGNLFFIGGEKWKNMRVKMTPTFTSGKMKLMLSILLDCHKPMLEHLEACCKNKQALDIKETAARFTTDIIGSAAFGIECNSFKNADPEFRRMGRMFLEESYTQMLKNMFAFNFHNAARKLHITSFPKDAEKFLTNVIQETMRFRKENNVTKNDFLQMLIKLHDEEQITFGELSAQAFVIFLAGFETSSTTMMFALFELAQNQDIQDKVRNEIRRVLAKYNGEITYEALGELIYTKQVIDETLRKHPPVLTVDRMCSKAYKLENENIIIPSGTSVIVSTYGIHYDPEYYPNPEKFDPDRFSPENIGNINPYTYLPFGEGPRLCIGQRFGIMQTKVGLVSLLKDYRYTLNEKTDPNLEYAFKFILTPIGNILLDMEKVN